MNSNLNKTARQRLTVGVAITCLLGLVATAHATTFINADFNVSSGGTSGTYTGTGAAPDAGTYWNPLNAGPHNTPSASFLSGNLLTSGGTAPSGVTVSLTNYTPYDLSTLGGGGAGTYRPLLDDFVYDQDQLGPIVATFTLNNLSPTGTYNLWIYAGGGAFGNQSTFTIGSTTLSFTAFTGNSTLSNATVTTTGNYVLFSDLSAPSGAISGVFSGANERFSGFQLEIIPEPSTVLLFISGGALLWFKRRK